MNEDAYDQYRMQEALQGREIEAQQNMGAPQMFEQVQTNQAVLVSQTNPKKVVKEIVLRLQGLKENPDGSTSHIAEPKINKKGVDNIWFILDSHINQNVILSHLESKEIKELMNGLQNDLVDDLSLNWRDYGIKKKSDLDVINNSVLFNVFLALKRAEGQGEKNWLGKISIENISGASRVQMPRKEGIWSKFRL